MLYHLAACLVHNICIYIHGFFCCGLQADDNYAVEEKIIGELHTDPPPLFERDTISAMKDLVVSAELTKEEN